MFGEACAQYKLVGTISQVLRGSTSSSGEGGEKKVDEKGDKNDGKDAKKEGKVEKKPLTAAHAARWDFVPLFVPKVCFSMFFYGVYLFSNLFG